MLCARSEDDVRIIGGELRGRSIKGPASEVTRPMVDRMRQALFNVLAHRDFGLERESVIVNATVLDAFCGTGALAFEALSRGAKTATLMDIDVGAVQVAKDNARELGVNARANVINANACAPIAPPSFHDLIFLAPPYYKGLLLPALDGLEARGWIGPAPLILAHVGTEEHFEFPPAFEVAHERVYGDSRFYFVTRRADSSP